MHIVILEPEDRRIAGILIDDRAHPPNWNAKLAIYQARFEAIRAYEEDNSSKPQGYIPDEADAWALGLAALIQFHEPSLKLIPESDIAQLY